jgi:allantoin racemase
VSRNVATNEEDGKTMTFRVKIISPLEATEADLARRRRRYSQQASPDTRVLVENLFGGPPALNTAGDVLASAAAIYEQGKNSSSEEIDAILIDCVFDPAIEELQEATGLPTFGPTRVTLPLIPLVATNFSIIARSERQCELLAHTVEGYGYGNQLCSLRALGISYEEAKQENIFNRVMLERLRMAVAEDGADAIVFGSTTMALTADMRAAAGGVPLFMPGMVALGVMEQLWHGGLWPGQGISGGNS